MLNIMYLYQIGAEYAHARTMTKKKNKKKCSFNHRNGPVPLIKGSQDNKNLTD